MLDIELLGNGPNKLRSELGPLVGNNFLGDSEANKNFLI
jgi:hypothetical protein